MSMFTPATKKALKARLALTGPTGSGKTWTGLEWARELGTRVAVIDTERGSASLYSDVFSFDVARIDPPFAPERLIEALKAAESYDVVLVDSFSHFWEGEGGVLDVVDAAAQRAHGNSFAGWKIGTPAQRYLVDTILGLDAHAIVTMRSKMEYVLEQDKHGKQVPRKVGMAPVQRAGVEYEFTLVGDLDLDHRLTITKSRCAALADLVIQPGRAAEAAETFARWLDSGEPMATREQLDAITVRFDAIEDPKERKAAKEAFVAAHGSPSHLTAAGAAAALTDAPKVEPPKRPKPLGGAPLASKEDRDFILARTKAFDADQNAALAVRWEEAGLPTVMDLNTEQVRTANDLLDAFERTAA